MTNYYDFRVPTISKETVILFPNGVQLVGTIFMPAVAQGMRSTMRLVDWLNSHQEFLPFKLHGKEETVLINKRNVLSLTTYHERDSEELDEADEANKRNAHVETLEVETQYTRRGEMNKRNVCIETLHGRFSGNLIIDQPQQKQRVLDELNDSRWFIYLLDGGKEVHVNKRFITTTVEIEG